MSWLKKYKVAMALGEARKEIKALKKKSSDRKRIKSRGISEAQMISQQRQIDSKNYFHYMNRAAQQQSPSHGYGLAGLYGGVFW